MRLTTQIIQEQRIALLAILVYAYWEEIGSEGGVYSRAAGVAKTVVSRPQ